METFIQDLAQLFLNRFYNLNFGFPKLTTSIFLRLKTIQFKMESIFKMAILRLSIRLSELCIFAVFRPTIFNFWILIEDYTRIIVTFEFSDFLSISSEIEVELGPSQIKISNDLDENWLNYGTFVSGGNLEFLCHFELLFLKIHNISIYGPDYPNMSLDQL
jgi:hypothetical protein